MSSPLVECVPNISEGRKPDVIKKIKESITSVQGAYVLDTHSDPDHNRSVITFVGAPEAVEEAAFRMIQKAAELIDLETHKGEHPRIGATDVVPFVPISNIAMTDCVAIAHRLGERVGNELNIPVFFYEEAALRPERKRLEIVRKGEYEGLKTEIKENPDRKPDCGPATLGSAGATVIGAREFLIAYNVNLNTDDEEIAKKIARKIRQSSGGLPFVKALGMTVDGLAQVSMNLTNFRKTPISMVVESIRKEAELYGVGILNSELVGLIPQDALVDTAIWYTQMDLFSTDQILERKMFSIMNQGDHKRFLDSLSDGTPTPGGGSAAAYTGAIAAALVAMVARLTIGKKGYNQVEKEMGQILDEVEELREELTKSVDEDSEAFVQVMQAYKIPKSDQGRQKAIQTATLLAAEVPLNVARKTLRVSELGLMVAKHGNKNAITDAGAAVSLANGAINSAGYNVRINLLSLENEKKTKKMLSEIKSLLSSSQDLLQEMALVLTERGKLP